MSIWDEMEAGLLEPSRVLTHETVFKAIARGRALEKVAGAANEECSPNRGNATFYRLKEALAKLRESEGK